MLSVTDDLLQIALRVTEDDGPLNGDMQLLRVMIGMDQDSTIIKPSSSREELQPGLRKANQFKEKKLIKMIKMAVGIEFQKIKEEASYFEESTLLNISKNLFGDKNESEASFSLNDTNSHIESEH